MVDSCLKSKYCTESSGANGTSLCELAEDSIPQPLKVFLLGDDKVGKKALIRKYLDGLHSTTLCKKHYHFTSRNTTYNLQLRNVKGSKDVELPDHFPWRQRNCWNREAIGAVFVYDVQCESSLHNISWYMEEFNALMSQENRESVPTILLGNKHDLGELDATAVCQQLGIQHWFYVSAKTGENVDTAFRHIIQRVLQSHSHDRKLRIDKLSASSFDEYDCSYSMNNSSCLVL